MFVNISRSKTLVNKNRLPRVSLKTAKKDQPRCNHCGGLVRLNGELASCIMCSREIGHVCDMCSYMKPAQMAHGKKSA